MEKFINLSNYALMLEKKAFLGESVNLSEGKDDPDEQTEAGLAKVKGGSAANSQYIAQWNQLIADYEKNKTKAGTYTVMIRHDNGQAMVNVQYSVGADGKPVKDSIKLAQTTNQAQPEISEADGFAKVKAASDAIAALFVEGSAFFAPFKGNWNDDDTGAATAFDNWYNSKWKATIDTLKSHSNADVKLSATNVSTAATSILSKMRGSFDANDSVVWNVIDAKGAYVKYEVDTDF